MGALGSRLRHWLPVAARYGAVLGTGTRGDRIRGSTRVLSSRRRLRFSEGGFVGSAQSPTVHLTKSSQARAPLICQRMSGGLGNQLFQASAAMSLSRRLGGQLSFDLTRYERDKKRRFELACFPTGASEWIPNAAARPRPAELLKAIRHRRKLRWGWSGSVYRQPDFGYDPAFETLDGDVYLDGLIQSELYFLREENYVRQVFDLEPFASARVRDLAASWAGQDLASVHIRRGDYAENPKVLAVMGLLDDSYYERSINVLRQISPSLRLKIFSDDRDAAIRTCELHPGAEPVVGDTAIDDMYLMSKCRHHIIANSTFSWWGAWLGLPHGLTIAPRLHFSREKLRSVFIHDHYPKGWLLI